MRRLLAAFTAVALLALAASSGAAPAGCAPAGAHTVAASGGARIYIQGGTVYGCLGARRTALGPASTVRLPGRARVVHYALGPRYAGIALAAMGIDTSNATVAIVDLRSGATAAHAAATSPEQRAESYMSVDSLVIDANGTIAWIGRRGAVGVPAPTFEVRTLSTGGSDRLLASSLKIDPRSLTLHGETLRWTDGGTARTRPIG